MKKNHLIWMIIGCTLPLLLIFLAPAIGLGQNYSLFLFILAMFAIHLLMPHEHGGHQHHSSPSKINKNEQHKH